MLRGVPLVRTGVLEERIASIIKMTRIYELVPDDGSPMFLRNVGSYKSHTS
jgi:hypothetical protein